MYPDRVACLASIECRERSTGEYDEEIGGLKGITELE